MATETEIKQMKRGELNALATEYGIDPDEYSRADDLRSAIFDYINKQADVEDAPETEESSTEESATKQSETSDEPQKKGPKPNPPRPQIERRSKRYQEVAKKFSAHGELPLTEAIKLVKESSNVKFDAAVEIHINLGVDPKQSDQLIRGSIVLPNGTGKSQKVAAFVPDEMKAEAKKAGADVIGADVLKQIEKSSIDFDIMVAHPSMMKDLSKHAKVLGPQGLMPSPKAGTVTEDIAKTISELKAGRIEYRVDRYGIIHQVVGRVSFSEKQLTENINALMSVVKASKPSSSKGVYLQKVSLTSSMGPSMKVAPSEF